MQAAAWLKEHWKPLAIVGAGAVGLYLLTRRGGSAAPPAGSDSSVPLTGPPQLGNQTPAGTFFGPAEQVAANLADQLPGLTMFASPVANGTDKAGHAEYSYGTGAVSKAWQQVAINGQSEWEDIFHPGHLVTESQAQQLSSQNSGPYAKGSGGFFGQVANFLKQAVNVYAQGQGVPVASTPPIAPRTQNYGNPPVRQPAGGISET